MPFGTLRIAKLLCKINDKSFNKNIVLFRRWIIRIIWCSTHLWPNKEKQFNLHKVY